VTVRRAQEATDAHGRLAGVGLDVPASLVDLGKEPAAAHLARAGDGKRAHAVSQVRRVYVDPATGGFPAQGHRVHWMACRIQVLPDRKQLTLFRRGKVAWPQPSAHPHQAGRGRSQVMQRQGARGFRFRTDRTPIPHPVCDRPVCSHARAGCGNISDLLSNHREPLLRNLGV